MPIPPPPPPVAPPPPMMGAPPPVFSPPKSSTDDRAALLKSIQRGAKLKKTVTNDKSAPMIGKTASSNAAPAASNGGSGYGGGPPMPNGMGLGGLFAGGMPKLKPTKNRLGITSSNNSNNSEQNGNIKMPRERSPVPPTPSFNFASIQNEVKKKLANDCRDRGPPPPTPSSESVTSELNHLSLQQSSSSGSFVSSGATANHSSLHRKTQSNVNLSSLDSNSVVTPSPASSLSTSTRSINHGKPNLAPKPPILNGKPKANPPKRLITNGKVVSRAHSLKSPRSPPVQDPPVESAIKYGTVRNMSSVLSHSIGNNLNSRSKMTLNGRPSAPPPSIPGAPQQMSSSAPAPPSKTSIMKPPNHAPPPPPGALPQPPNHAPPPPPPHKALPAKPSGLNFSSSQTPPPPPPPRNSSMRDQNSAYKKQTSILDFDDRFKEMFRSPNSFPKPPPFRNVLKIYSNRQVVSKQQAPPPPSPLLPNNRHWDVPSSC